MDRTSPARPALNRRRLFLGMAGIGGATVLTACTSNSSGADAAPAANVGAGGGDNDKPGTAVTIGFSAPAADHGWPLGFAS